MEVKEPSTLYRAYVEPVPAKAGVGSVPTGWKVVRISDAGEVLGGRQRSPHAQGQSTKYLRVANVFDGHIDTSDVLEMPFTEAERARFRLRCGDILLNEGQSLDLVGRSAIFRGQPADCCFQNTLLRFRARPGNVPEYAQMVFQRYLRTGVFASIAMQTTSIAHLGAARFAALAIALPPTGEQGSIAEALSDADGLVESLALLLDKKHQIKQGALQDLLTGRRRLKGFYDRWPSRALGDLGNFLKGRGITRDQALSGHIPCVRYGEIYTAHHDCIRVFHSWISAEVAASATLLKKGDLLFAGSGETKAEIGKCVAFVDDFPAYAGGDIVILRPRGMDSIFLGYALNSPAVAQQKASRGQGDAVVHISATALADIALPIPPLDEQTAIATTLSDMDAEITALEARLAKARALKQGMAQALLTGRIRLI